MFITKVELQNFRNYIQLIIEPSKGLNILVGKNAQGKSAVLEAVYVLSTSKSHRTSKDLDMIDLRARRRAQSTGGRQSGSAAGRTCGGGHRDFVRRAARLRHQPGARFRAARVCDACWLPEQWAHERFG